MSDGPYPMLVLNRRFASNGKPWWQCEMRFTKDDVESCDGYMDLTDTLAKCKETWGIRSFTEHTYQVAQDVAGQKYDSVTLPEHELEENNLLKVF